MLLVPGYGDVVLAFDAASGDLLWQYTPPAGTRGGYKKNLAVYGDKVYAALQTGHMIALNIRTGEVVWNGVVREGVGITGGPLAVRGKIIVGTTGLAATGGQIVALDAQTGKVAWRFKTIAQPGEPGGESWNGETAEQRTGASVWTAGSYDVESNLVYFGAGQTYNTGPLRKKIDQPGVTTDALYTDTTLALDPDTGKLAWFYQHMKNDQWDMDWAFERTVFTMKIDGRYRRVVATAGKPGLYDVLDARTGQYLFSEDMGIQNLITAVDRRTGEKTYNAALDPATRDKWTLCPYFNSGKEWLPGSYSDLSKLVYVPLNEACTDMFKLPPGEQGLLTGLGFIMQPPANHDGNYSHLAAWNPQTRKIEWVLRQRAPLTTGTLATQGGLVFTGFTDRRFKAFDDATGEELWSTRLSDTSQRRADQLLGEWQAVCGRDLRLLQLPDPRRPGLCARGEAAARPRRHGLGIRTARRQEAAQPKRGGRALVEAWL